MSTVLEVELQKQGYDHNDSEKINFIYFQDSGKYYTSGSVVVKKRLIKGCAHPREIGRKLNELKMLPGLQSGSWKGPFVCDPVNLYPELIND